MMYLFDAIAVLFMGFLGAFISAIPILILIAAFGFVCIKLAEHEWIKRLLIIGIIIYIIFRLI